MIVEEIVIVLDLPVADDIDVARCLIVHYSWKGFATGDTNQRGLHRGFSEVPNFETIVVCMYICVKGSRQGRDCIQLNVLNKTAAARLGRSIKCSWFRNFFDFELT